MPTRKSENSVWIHPSRLPLGAGWDGTCTAPGEQGAIPSEEELKRCNLGYACDCPRLPKERKWDAVRFAVTGKHDSRFSLVYVCERNHLPSEHGRLEYSLSDSRWSSSHRDARIQKMAECFLESWRANSLRTAHDSGTEQNDPEATEKAHG